jgi:hypothetical protein
MVSGCDDVVGHFGENVESGVAFRVGGRFGVDEAVAVDAIAGINEEEVDTAVGSRMRESVLAPQNQKMRSAGTLPSSRSRWSER